LQDNESCNPKENAESKTRRARRKRKCTRGLCLMVKPNVCGTRKRRKDGGPEIGSGAQSRKESVASKVAKVRRGADGKKKKGQEVKKAKH